MDDTGDKLYIDPRHVLKRRLRKTVSQLHEDGLDNFVHKKELEMLVIKQDDISALKDKIENFEGTVQQILHK